MDFMETSVHGIPGVCLGVPANGGVLQNGAANATNTEKVRAAPAMHTATRGGGPEPAQSMAPSEALPPPPPASSTLSSGGCV